MLTSHTNVEVRTETDLTTGRKAFVVALNPVPVITPVGPAPGELRIEAEVTGRISAIKAILRPTAQAVGETAELLSQAADFELPAGELRGLPASVQPTLTFAAKPEALQSLGMLRAITAQDLSKLLDAPMLADVKSFALVDLAIDG